MQAAARFIAPTPSPPAMPAAGGLSADAMAGSGPGAASADGGDSGAADRPAGAGDAFAQALAALMGLTPVALQTPISSQPAGGNQTAAAGGLSSTGAATSSAAFGASLLQAATPSAQAPTAAIPAAASTILVPLLTPTGPASDPDGALTPAQTAALAASTQKTAAAPTATDGAQADGAQDNSVAQTNAAQSASIQASAAQASAALLGGDTSAAAKPAPSAPSPGAAPPAASVTQAASMSAQSAPGFQPKLSAATIGAVQLASGASEADGADLDAAPTANIMAAATDPAGTPTTAPAAKPSATAKTATPSENGKTDTVDGQVTDVSTKPTPPPAPAFATLSGSAHGDRSDPSPVTQAAQPAPSPSVDASLAAIAAPPVAASLPQAGTAALAAANGAAIVSQIADQVVKSVDGKSTRFDIALNPAGLGQVNVKIEINASGQVSAALSFANPHTAAEAKAHAGDLQQALEQAGFNLSQGGLSFDGGGQGASLARQNQDQSFQGGGAAATPFANAGETPITAPAWTPTRAASGVDITI